MNRGYNLTNKKLRMQRAVLLLIILMLVIVSFMLNDIVIEQDKLIRKQEELINEQELLIELIQNNSLSNEIVQAVPEPIVIEPTEFVVTAYCPCIKCCGKTDGITKSGVQAVANKTIAMDESYPMGTQVIMEGYEDIVFEKQDIGGAIKGNRIDRYFDTHEEALQFGRQTLKVWILPPETPEGFILNF